MFLSLWSTSSYSMTHSRQSLVHGQQPQVFAAAWTVKGHDPSTASHSRPW